MRVAFLTRTIIQINVETHFTSRKYARLVFEPKCRLQAPYDSRKNSLTNQSKIQAQLDQKEAQIPKQIYLGQGLASHLDTRDIRIAHWRKLGTVGAPLHN